MGTFTSAQFHKRRVWRHQMGSQNPYTVSASICGFFLFLYEEVEDTEGVIRIRKSKNRQHNGQKKMYKRTNNDLQNIHLKLKIE